MRLVLAESNELVLMGIRAVLSKEENVEIVAEANCEERLFEALSFFKADVLLIDYTAKGFKIDNLLRLLTDFPEVKTVAITPEQSAKTLVDALRMGIKSYVKKDCSLGEIVDAIKATGRGEQFFCGQILETIQEANLCVDDIEIDAFSCEPVILTEREKEVIVLISEGLTNTQIAEKLFVSTHTVATHRKNVMNKLGLKNTAGIVMYAVKMNFISPNKFLFEHES